jgi:uncharacterized protein (UPF0335 family)
MTLDGRIWKQTDGCPIGKSISGEIAEIYMRWFEEEYVYSDKKFKPLLWKRMRDDVFVIYEDEHQAGGAALETFLNRLNSYEKRIQFTIEKEEDGVLPFLDMTIRRKEQKLVTKVYRKKTHTEQYLNWKSNHSKNCLKGVMKNLIHRAHDLCDEKEDVIQELNHLRDTFISNGYPPSIVEKTITESWKEAAKRFLSKITNKAEEKEHEFYDVLHAPYIRGFSEEIQVKLRNLNVGFVMKNEKTIQSLVCRGMKPKRVKERRKEVVYAVGCGTCGEQYIGETGKMISQRIKQHKRDVANKKIENGIFNHMKHNKKHDM